MRTRTKEILEALAIENIDVLTLQELSDEICMAIKRKEATLLEKANLHYKSICKERYEWMGFIEAIRLFRECTGAGLTEAKWIIDKWRIEGEWHWTPNSWIPQ